jgi:6-phosphofructokinase 1
MRIGVLTSGGDCPGLNAVLRAVARCGEGEFGDEILGFRDAWRGVLDGDWEPITIDRCRGILPRGGTILGTSRVQPYQFPDGLQQTKNIVEELELTGFIVIGGEGSLSAAHQLNADGVPCVGVPKTIDNDIVGTDVTFGFDTAVSVAAEAVDRLQTTSERVMVLEVMGRHAGHIAVHSGLAGGAAAILCPEVPFDIDDLVAAVLRRRARGVYGTVVVVAEGSTPAPGTIELPAAGIDEFGHQRLGGIGELVAAELEARTGIECRVTTLGYTQRGGTPTAYDRVLATRMGVAAVRAAHDGKWGTMSALRSDEVVQVDLAEMAGKVRGVSPELIEKVAALFSS